MNANRVQEDCLKYIQQCLSFFLGQRNNVEGYFEEDLISISKTMDLALKLKNTFEKD